MMLWRSLDNAVLIRLLRAMAQRLASARLAPVKPPKSPAE